MRARLHLATMRAGGILACVLGDLLTSRALVLHEAPLTGGFGGEIASTIGQRGFEWLDAPVMRVGSLDTPVPFSKALEARFSAHDRLMATLKELLSY